MTDTSHLTPLKVTVATVGCRANQADSSALARCLDPRYVTLTDTFNDIDLAIINTCCVTAEAERDCRKTARRVLKRSPQARVVLVGCAVNAVDAFGEGIDPRVETRGGSDAAPRALADWIHERAGAAPGDVSPPGVIEPLRGRTRVLLKIQNGCSHGCAYCIVPKARGRETSMPEAAVLADIDRIADNGAGEVVITGVQLGAWGKDLPNRPRLADLIVEIADRFAPGRVRLSSIEPWSVDDALIEVLGGHDRVCRHLHMPLQNGDNDILRAMRRGYTVEQFLATVDKVREAAPDIALGTDVLLGFPGETDAAFENTLSVLRTLETAYLHAFSYSPRPGTRAATFPNRPAAEIVRDRNRQVRSLGARSSAAYRASHNGQTRELIIEERREDQWRGLTDTFVKVRLQASGLREGALVRATLQEVAGRDHLTATNVNTL